MKLNVRAFALTCAVVWGLALPLATWWLIAIDGPSTDPTLIGHFYRGYSLTFVGSLIGAAWAFLDGFVGGAVFAWLYDAIEARFLKTHRITA